MAGVLSLVSACTSDSVPAGEQDSVGSPDGVTSDDLGSQDTAASETDTEGADTGQSDTELVDTGTADTGQPDTAVADTGTPPADATGPFPMTVKGNTFTENTCLEGLPWLQGKYRYYWEVSDPDPVTGKKTITQPAKDEYYEIATFDDLSVQFHMQGPDEGGYVDAIMTGWYFCPNKQEMPSEMKVFLIENITVPGAFGNVVPDQWRCDLLGGMNDFLLACDVDWDPGRSWEFQATYIKCVDAACEEF